MSLMELGTSLRARSSLILCLEDHPEEHGDVPSLFQKGLLLRCTLRSASNWNSTSGTWSRMSSSNGSQDLTVLTCNKQQQTNKDKQTKTNKQRKTKKKNKQTNKLKNKQTDKLTNKRTNKLTSEQANKRTSEQANKRTNEQTNKLTSEQTNKLTN